MQDFTSQAEGLFPSFLFTWLVLIRITDVFIIVVLARACNHPHCLCHNLHHLDLYSFLNLCHQVVDSSTLLFVDLYFLINHHLVLLWWCMTAPVMLHSCMTGFQSMVTGSHCLSSLGVKNFVPALLLDVLLNSFLPTLLLK